MLGLVAPSTPPRACARLHKLLNHFAFGNALLARAIRRRQIFHDMQPGKGIVGVEDAAVVFAAQIVFHIFARQRGAAADHRELQLLMMQVLHHVLHLQRRLHQQAAEPDGVGLLLDGRFDDRVRRLLDAEIHHAIAVVGEDDVDQVLADVVDVALHRREHDGRLLAALLLLHLRLEIGDRGLHHAGRVEHRRQLHLARAKQVADRPHAVEQDVVDQVERRIVDQRLFQQFVERLLVLAVAHTLFAVDDRPLQLVFDRQRIDVRGGRLLLALGPGKVVHVDLQRIAVGLVVENQLARQINFGLRNLVQRINLAVVHDGHVEAVVHRLVHEDAVQNAPRIDIQSERNVADAEDRLHLGQLGLDRLHRLQRLDAGGAIVFLAGRDGQRQRVEDQIAGTNAVLVHRQIEDALGDGQLLLPGQRHAVFVDGQRDDGRAVALGHGQNFRRCASRHLPN